VKVRTKRNIGHLFGITAMLMLFVIPFIIMAINEPLLNSSIFCWVYFTAFLSFIVSANLIAEKTTPSNLIEHRDEALEEFDLDNDIN